MPQSWIFRRPALPCALTGVLLLLTGTAIAAPVAIAGPESSAISAYALAAPRSTAASGLVARAIIPAGARCPRLVVTSADGVVGSRAMTVRPRPERTSPAFDSLTVCSAVMPVGASTATIAGRPIPATMPTRIDRLAMLADSGCRITASRQQNCADDEAWPLARISSAVEREDPDAILFNGDFFYREAACPVAVESWCESSPAPVAGMPFTDSAYGWLADVFVPMAPMLSAAPLIVTRGNHEACHRGGNGYFYFFDPREGTSSTCAPVLVNGQLTAAPTVPSESYAIDLAVSPGRTLRLAIVDSAGGNDSAVDSYAAVQRPAYQRASMLTAERAGRESWLLTHRPIYALITTEFATPGKPFTPWGSADQAAAAWGLLDTYDLIFSSHVHVAQAIQLPGLPGQLVLGNAGTALDPATGYPLPTTGEVVGTDKSYPAPTSGWVDVRFGYVMATPQSSGGAWRLAMRDPSGSTFATCGLRNRSIFCRSTS